MTDNHEQTSRVAVITGASMGLGLEVASALTARAWHVVVDARDGVRLAQAFESLPRGSHTLVPGDVADPRHRAQLTDAVAVHGRLDLLLNNASVLGPSPQPALADDPLDTLHQVFAVNTLAPLALFQLLLPTLRSSRAAVVNVSSDAAVEAYPGWGGYGSAKAALDQLTAVLAVEHPELSVYAFDPGDMATSLHQQAFPGQDISDRPPPALAAAALLALLDRRPASGRYRGTDLPLPQGISS
jgi:NAD(P)-dependent dehydrogenase (short-subunit alcohol dehydrogenase family)